MHHLCGMKKIFRSLILFLFYGFHCHAQKITNGNFENWHVVPFSFGNFVYDPDGWTSTNGASAPANTVGILKGTNAFSGAYALEIHPLICMGPTALTSAICMGTAPVDWDTYKMDYRKGGLPISYKPAHLKGYYNFEPLDSERDSAYAIVLLKKYDLTSKKSIVVGKGSYVFGTSKAYSPFDVDIADSMPSTLPDSMVVAFFFQSHTKDFRSYDHDLFIDSVFLSGNSAIHEIGLSENQSIDLYPTLLGPFDQVNISTQNINKDLDLKIYDGQGKTILCRIIPTHVVHESITLPHLQSGLYFYEVYDGQQILKSGKILVNAH